jgi:hypothetical protein
MCIVPGAVGRVLTSATSRFAAAATTSAMSLAMMKIVPGLAPAAWCGVDRGTPAVDFLKGRHSKPSAAMSPGAD